MKWYPIQFFLPSAGLITFLKLANFIRERYLSGQMEHMCNFQLFLGEELLDSGQGKDSRNAARIYTPEKMYSRLRNVTTGCFVQHTRTVCLFGSQECPKIHLDRNPRQNCPIGQPSTKKWFFSPGQFGPWPERKGKSGEIRSLLETLGGTLYPPKKNHTYQNHIWTTTSVSKMFVDG